MTEEVDNHGECTSNSNQLSDEENQGSSSPKDNDDDRVSSFREQADSTEDHESSDEDNQDDSARSDIGEDRLTGISEITEAIHEKK